MANFPKAPKAAKRPTRGRPAGAAMPNTLKVIEFLKKNSTTEGCKRAATKFGLSMDRIYQIRRTYAKAIGYTPRAYRPQKRVRRTTPALQVTNPDGATALEVGGTEFTVNGRLRKSAEHVLRNVIEALPKHEQPLCKASLALLVNES